MDYTCVAGSGLSHHQIEVIGCCSVVEFMMSFATVIGPYIQATYPFYSIGLSMRSTFHSVDGMIVYFLAVKEFEKSRLQVFCHERQKVQSILRCESNLELSWLS